jgi:hypothetical protein
MTAKTSQKRRGKYAAVCSQVSEVRLCAEYEEVRQPTPIFGAADVTPFRKRKPEVMLNNTEAVAFVEKVFLDILEVHPESWYCRRLSS